MRDGGETRASERERSRPAPGPDGDLPPSPLAARLLHCLLALLGGTLLWASFGRLDIVAVAQGRLVPRLALPIVQPATTAVIRDILVAEGETVLPGQVLVRLDASEIEAETRALAAELTARLLQLRRIDAELADRPLDRLPGDADDAYARAVALHAANRAAYRDAVAQEAALLARASQELAAAVEVEAKLARTLPIYRTLDERYRRLQREGFVSELAALERERERIEKEHEQRAQEHTVASLRAGIAQAERRLAQVTSNHRAQLHAERAQAAGQRARVAEELAKGLARAAGIELRAPQAGVVKELATHTRGAVVAAGTVLLTLVPAGEELQAEVLIPNADVGFVRAGQTARVKLAAYPFQKYGLVDGVIERVSPDAAGGATGRRDAPPDAATDPGTAYRARVVLAGQSLPFDGRSLPLAAGMQAVAEIRLGERTLLEYLVAPVRRAWHDAARER
ncbi:MAG: HlyD family type I secretion periplasmic adaptor subunit [Betaproteobacteria bacterium]|nr:HlyD family type I secretion periplasmic adaptor subunit [Betaproteobacteria bacterium]